MAFQPSRTCVLLAALALPTHASGADRVVLRGNIPAAATLAEPLGRPDPGMPMTRMILSLAIAPEAQARMNTLLAQQQDPASAHYHQWLTPEAFGAQFGPAQQDLDTVSAWLKESGFTVERVSAGRTAIVFSGDVQRVEQAFQTLILDYQMEGKAFHANTVEPSIPGALAGLVQGVVSLHNLPRKSMSHAPTASGLYTTPTGGHYMAPGDFATIYNLKPLYNAGINGTGVTIAIVGRTHPALSDITTFRSQFGLPVNNPTYIVNGSDPGDLGSNENIEADLDMQWAGAVARNASVRFVMSRSTASTDGVDLSAHYIVDNNLAAIMSTSFGACEGSLGSAENAFYNNLWAQAAAQGITALVASGDSGVAGCSQGSASSGSGQGVNGLASTPYNICVGGTQFNEGGGSYWSAGNGSDQSSALGYIPEKAWNESGTVTGGSGLWASGGGVSLIYAKPAWQVAPGVPSDGRRDVPDVSLSAAGHDAYLVRSGGGLVAVGGTSGAAPAFAGLMALVVQKTGQRQGNANPVLYQMGNAQYRGAGPTVFHDILTGNNSVPGATGYSCGTGYSLVTGLGSVDAQALVSNWKAVSTGKVTASIAAPSVNETVASGATIGFIGTASDTSTGATLSYSWNFGDGASATGASATGASPSHTFSNPGSASVAYAVVLTVTDNSGISGSATRTITVAPAPRNTLSATIASPAANLTVANSTSVAFAGTGKDSSTSATLGYSWNFGDGGSATGSSPSHTFSNTGSTSLARTVTLTVTDNTGVSASASRIITVAPRNTLTAAITSPAANLTVASGTTVAFTGTGKDSSASATLGYSWNFGDGASATGASASHKFSNLASTSAAYAVTVTVTDNTGVVASTSRSVTVSPAPRNTLSATIASPAANLTVANNSTVAFAGTGKDSSASATLGYSWNFGDGSGATGANPSHSFSNAGGTSLARTVTLTVTDNTGVSASASRTITVAPRNTLTAAIASPAANLTVASGTTVAFTGTGKDSSTTATLGYSWNFGDGSGATGASASHKFSNLASVSVAYPVTVTVTDNTGVVASASRSITVSPAPRNTLTAAIASPATNLTVASGTTVAFTGTGKDSSTTATLGYSWNFGDGSGATGSSSSHTFSNPGSTSLVRTVTLTVTDNTGVTSSATRSLTISPAPSPLSAVIGSPAANITVASGTTVQLTGTATDSNPSPVISYSWSASAPVAARTRTLPLVSPTALNSVCSATFSNTGRSAYSVTFTFTVSDNKGAKASATRTITVNPA